MKKLFLVALVCLVITNSPLKAQYYYSDGRHYYSPLSIEVGATGGVMNSLTDLGGKRGVGKNFVKDLRWKTARPSYGVYIAGTFQDVVVVRLEGTFGQVVGYDSILKSVASTTNGRYERNLSFKSKISEIQLAVEVHPLFFKKYDNEDPPRLSPYVVAGVGNFSFDPQARLNGQWYALQPLHLEGQGFAEYPDRKPYKLNQFNVMAGLGLKYEISPSFNARVEFVNRFLNTDYLDDVSQTDYIDPSLFSHYLPTNLAAIAQQLYNRTGELNPSDIGYTPNIQRGDPSNKDSYFTIQFKLGLVLGHSRR